MSLPDYTVRVYYGIYTRLHSWPAFCPATAPTPAIVWRLGLSVGNMQPTLCVTSESEATTVKHVPRFLQSVSAERRITAYNAIFAGKQYRRPTRVTRTLRMRRWPHGKAKTRRYILPWGCCWHKNVRSCCCF